MCWVGLCWVGSCQIVQSWIVLRCVELYCTVLCYAGLGRVGLFCAVLDCGELCCSVLFYAVSGCVGMCCAVMVCVGLCCVVPYCAVSGRVVLCWCTAGSAFHPAALQPPGAGLPPSPSINFSQLHTWAELAAHWCRARANCSPANPRCRDAPDVMQLAEQHFGEGSCFTLAGGRVGRCSAWT